MVSSNHDAVELKYVESISSQGESLRKYSTILVRATKIIRNKQFFFLQQLLQQEISRQRAQDSVRIVARAEHDGRKPICVSCREHRGGAVVARLPHQLTERVLGQYTLDNCSVYSIHT